MPGREVGQEQVCQHPRDKGSRRQDATSRRQIRAKPRFLVACRGDVLVVDFECCSFSSGVAELS